MDDILLHLPELIQTGSQDHKMNNFMGTSEPNTFQTQELRGLIDQINPFHNDSRNEVKTAGQTAPQNAGNNLGLER